MNSSIEINHKIFYLYIQILHLEYHTVDLGGIELGEWVQNILISGLNT